MIKRKVLASTSPDIVITVNGKNMKIDTITSVKTLNLEFTLDTPYKTDPGNHQMKSFLFHFHTVLLFYKNNNMVSPTILTKHDYKASSHLVHDHS